MSPSSELLAYLYKAHGPDYFNESRGYDDIEFVKDLLIRQAFWEQAKTPGSTLSEDLKGELVNWVAEVAPNGVAACKESTMWAGIPGERLKEVFNKNYPQAFKLIFG